MFSFLGRHILGVLEKKEEKLEVFQPSFTHNLGPSEWQTEFSFFEGNNGVSFTVHLLFRGELVKSSSLNNTMSPHCVAESLKREAVEGYRTFLRAA